MRLKVYPLKTSFGWIIGKNKWRLNKKKKNTDTIISITNNYFSIDGDYYQIHKARIIIQDLEKQFHKLGFNQ